MATDKTLHERLAEVQAKLNAPKNLNNTFGGYKYRSCEGILEAVKPLLKENGLVLTVSDELLDIGDRYYIKSTTKVSLSEAVPASEFISVSAYAREEETKKGMDGSQITGTASSYARKYALNGLFLIDDTKDADTNEHHVQTASSSSPTVTKQAIATATSKSVGAGEGYYNEYEKKTYYPEPCTHCGREVNAKSVSFSTYKFGRNLCFDCQKLAEAGELDDPKNDIQSGNAQDELDSLFKQNMEANQWKTRSQG